MTEEMIQQADVHLAAPGSLSALRAATVGVPLGGWQPIKTAPKDAYVLLWVDIAVGPPLIVQGCWFEVSKRERGWIDADGEVIDATHWMPLPGAPTGQSRTPLSLSELDALARVYASNYASPHHFTLGVNGLRSLLEDATEQSRTSEAGEATCASNEPDEQDTSSVSQRMAQDAARYRFLRDTPWSPELERAIALHQNAKWDELIDAALPLPQPTGERE